MLVHVVRCEPCYALAFSPGRNKVVAHVTDGIYCPGLAVDIAADDIAGRGIECVEDVDGAVVVAHENMITRSRHRCTVVCGLIVDGFCGQQLLKLA